MLRLWEKYPPAPQQLRRIARFLGAEPPTEQLHTEAQKPIEEVAAMAGIPISDTLPNDPVLSLLDAPIGTRLTH